MKQYPLNLFRLKPGSPVHRPRCISSSLRQGPLPVGTRKGPSLLEAFAPDCDDVLGFLHSQPQTGIRFLMIDDSFLSSYAHCVSSSIILRSLASSSCSCRDRPEDMILHSSLVNSRERSSLQHIKTWGCATGPHDGVLKDTSRKSDVAIAREHGCTSPSALPAIRHAVTNGWALVFCQSPVFFWRQLHHHFRSLSFQRLKTFCVEVSVTLSAKLRSPAWTMLQSERAVLAIGGGVCVAHFRPAIGIAQLQVRSCLLKARRPCCRR